MRIKQSSILSGLHSFHKIVWNPDCSIQTWSTKIRGTIRFFKIQEFVNIVMSRLHIHDLWTSSTTSLHNPIDRRIKNFDKRDWSWRFRVDTLDVRTACSQFGDRSSYSSSVFSKHSCFGNFTHNVFHAITDHIDITAWKLRKWHTWIIECRCRMHIKQGRKFLVDLDRKWFFICFTEWQSHRYTHPKSLWFFNGYFLTITHQVSIRNRWDSKKVELMIVLWFEVLFKKHKIKIKKFLIQEFFTHSILHIFLKRSKSVGNLAVHYFDQLVGSYFVI